MWRPPERVPPSAAAQRGWGAGDLSNSPRGEFPLGGSAGGAGAGGLPSMYELQQRGPAGTTVAMGAGGGSHGLGRPGASGAPAWGEGGGAGFQQEQPVGGEYGNRWGGMAAAA
ncbi:unnamed protein product, partial [Pylaiella littoralis]